MNPFFSVIAPVYNVEMYLRGCLDGILAQDERDFEVILVDDGAKDSSGQICDEYAARHDFIRVVHKENGGLASARNAGLAVARGEYVIMPDSDDGIEPDTLSVLRKTIAGAKASGVEPDIVHFDAFWHRAEREEMMNCTLAGGLYTNGKEREILQAGLLHSEKYALSAWSCAYRRAFLEENELTFVSEREVLSEDFLFNLSALMMAKSVYVLNKPQYHYYSRAGSLTHSPKPRMAERYTRLYEELCRFARAHGVYEANQKQLATFYVFRLIYRNYIHAEYVGWRGTTWAQARKNVKDVLKWAEVKAATHEMDLKRLGAKDRLRCLCMRFGLEAPLAFSYRDQRKRS